MTTMQELTGTECPTEILQLINLLVTQKSNIDLSNLSQTGQGILDGKASINLDNLSSLGQAILDKKVEVEALLQQNGYAKFSWKENNQISRFIIQWVCFSAGSQAVVIDFPISFTSVSSYVVIRQRNDYITNNNTETQRTCAVQNYTLASCRFFPSATGVLLAVGY